MQAAEHAGSRRRWTIPSRARSGEEAAARSWTSRCVQEGEQYFVNRINFVGNTTTRDNVVRREMRLLEGGVFNTEAMKFSIRKINQLGYFKNIEEGPTTRRSRRSPARRTRSTSR